MSASAKFPRSARLPTTAWLAAMGGAYLHAGGCAVLTEPDRRRLTDIQVASATTGGGDPGPGGAGGTGGQAGGAGGEAGAGGICIPADCPGVDTDCRRRACDDDGACIVVSVIAGIPCDDGERAGQVCDGEGACVECNDEAHCNGAPCVDHTCVR